MGMITIKDGTEIGYANILRSSADEWTCHRPSLSRTAV
jgi:hypothetical protein